MSEGPGAAEPRHKQKRPTLESRQTQGEATMTLLPTPSVLLPTGELDENRAINRLADLISMVRHRMEKEYSREWLETEQPLAREPGSVASSHSGDPYLWQCHLILPDGC